MCQKESSQEWESDYNSSEYCPHCECSWEDCECTPADRCPVCFTTDSCECEERWPDGQPDCVLN